LVFNVEDYVGEFCIQTSATAFDVIRCGKYGEPVGTAPAHTGACKLIDGAIDVDGVNQCHPDSDGYQPSNNTCCITGTSWDSANEECN